MLKAGKIFGKFLKTFSFIALSIKLADKIRYNMKVLAYKHVK